MEARCFKFVNQNLELVVLKGSKSIEDCFCFCTFFWNWQSWANIVAVLFGGTFSSKGRTLFNRMPGFPVLELFLAYFLKWLFFLMHFYKRFFSICNHRISLYKYIFENIYPTRSLAVHIQLWNFVSVIRVWFSSEDTCFWRMHNNTCTRPNWRIAHVDFIYSWCVGSQQITRKSQILI